jgi:hypothetical protein
MARRGCEELRDSNHCLVGGVSPDQPFTALN